MPSGSGPPYYHRRESPTQTPAVAAQQEASGEVWGRASIFSTFPKVKAYGEPLRPGQRGIEFTTNVLPDYGSYPYLPEWSESSGPRQGVVVENGFAKIKVNVTRNTQV